MHLPPKGILYFCSDPPTMDFQNGISLKFSLTCLPDPLHSISKTPRSFLFFQNWSIVSIQCCVNFRCTAVLHTRTHTSYILFQIIFQYRLLQNMKYSSLCYTVGPCWLTILYIVVTRSFFSFFFFFFFFFLGGVHGIRNFPGQGLSHSSNLSQGSDNAESLTAGPPGNSPRSFCSGLFLLLSLPLQPSSLLASLGSQFQVTGFFLKNLNLMLRDTFRCVILLIFDDGCGVHLCHLNPSLALGHDQYRAGSPNSSLWTQDSIFWKFLFQN